MTTTDTTTYDTAEALRALATAIEAMTPYMVNGTCEDAPEALQSACADVILNAPQSCWDTADSLEPGISAGLLAWAQNYVERGDYPEFFAALKEIGRIRDEQGEEAAAAPEHAELFMKMMRAAPPRYWGEAETILADALPTATHVDDHGQPVYSAEQLAEKLGVSIEEVEAGIQHMEEVGFSEGLHTGPVHPIQ